jgi:hypothetical protein
VAQVRKNKNIIFVILGFVVAVISLTIILGLSSGIIARKIQTIIPSNTIIERIEEKEKYLPSIIREDINRVIIYNASFFVNKYNQEIGNAKVAERIIIISLEEKVPINISIATAFVESKYDPLFNKNRKIVNNDGSMDKGIMGQNSRSFPKVDPFDLEEHLRATITYLRQKYEKYGSWEKAIIFYNCGSEERLGLDALGHLDRVLKKERELDVLFVSYFNELRGNK